MMDKSYVTLATCPICGEENGSLLLDKRLRPKFEMHTPTLDPCDKCKEKYLKTGTLLINPQNGDLIILKDEAFDRIFNKPRPTGKICFCEQEVLDNLNAQ